MKLPREITDAIEGLRNAGWTDYFIVVKSHETDAANQEIRTIRNWIRNNTGSFDDESEKAATHLLQALVNGYEVEQTPEERLVEYYDFYRKPMNDVEASIKTAIERTLDIFNIKIEGVNA